jgi:SRSO17 transposase
MGLATMAAEGTDRFTKYMEKLTSVIGHADRRTPLHDYCLGLLAADGRKSVEPMASVTAPASVSAQHQKLLHFVANSPWSDARVLAKARDIVVPEIERHGPIKVWIIDDTSFPKQGEHSVGVKHQYCGQLGKQANCQVAVTLSVANAHASLPIAYQLYLPKEWAEDAERRKKARVPDEIKFKTKPQIALDQLRAACAAGVPRGVVLDDSSYGSNSALRASMSELGLPYVVGIIPTIKVQAVLRRGKLGTRLSAKGLALKLPKHAWRTITWREGTNKVLRSRFARVQVHTAPMRRAAERPEETLLIEWPEGEDAPTKYWLSTVDKNISFRALVDLAKMRWRVERDYQDLKQVVGLGHYEGRSWPGFHHHGTLCIAVYGFLVSERETIPPSGPGCSIRFEMPALPRGYRPRGAAAAAATSRPQLDRNLTPESGSRDRPGSAAAMSRVCAQLPAKFAQKFVTQ